MVRLLIQVICLTMLTVGSQSATAKGFVATQEVKRDGTASTYSWAVSGRKFRLDVKNSEGTRYFVFNGRVLYVCAKLTTAQKQFIEGIKGLDAKVRKSLSKGICQRSSPDFLLQFYLNPYDAIASAEPVDGGTINVKLTSHDVSLGGGASSEAGEKCVGFNRELKFAAPTGEYGITETSCHAPKLDWRKSMGREVGKAVMRQAKVRSMAKLIKADGKQMTGMSLKIDQTRTNADQSTNTLTVATKGINKAGPSKRDLDLPKGFKVMDKKTLAALAAVKSVKKPNGGKGGGLADVVTFFLIGGNPATAVMKSLNDGQKKGE